MMRIYDGSHARDRQVAQDMAITDSQNGKVPGWPTEPRKLAGVRLPTLLSYVCDSVLVALSLAFYALGLMALILHDRPTLNNRMGVTVEKACKLGPTIFPMLFAAVAGRSLKIVGRFWAARGINLATLESLTSSQSVPSTIECQLLLRRASAVGALLLSLWCLSPLGGQASIRILQRSHDTTSTSVPLRYLSTGPASAILASYNFSAKANKALYPLSVVLPRVFKSQHQDLWGNVKVPFFEALGSAADVDGWKSVPERVGADNFSSFLGLPVVGRPRDEAASFSIESTYYVADCDSFTSVPIPKDEMGYSADQKDIDKISERIKTNLTETFKLGLWPGDKAAMLGQRTYFIQPNRTFDESRQRAFLSLDLGDIDQSPAVKIPRRVIFGSLYKYAVDGNSINIAGCNVFQTQVESEIHCAKTNCRVTKMRRSVHDTRPRSLSLFDSIRLTQYLALYMPIARDKEATASSPDEIYLSGGSQFSKGGYRPPLDNTAYVDLSKVPPAVFSARFSILLNTFYLQSLAADSYRDDLSDNLTLYGNAALPASDMEVFAGGRGHLDLWRRLRNYTVLEGLLDRNAMDVQRRMYFLGARATADVSTTTEVFVCRYLWLAVLLFSAGVLLVTGVTALLLMQPRTLAPDMLRCVGSLTYANPHFPTPPGATSLDAMERTRLLADEEVWIADVNEKGHIGEVAFLSARQRKPRRLERGRLYF